MTLGRSLFMITFSGTVDLRSLQIPAKMVFAMYNKN